jgi:formate hydrogenlyase subunit 3/multisubunit Na+/H+ antiporter MnhD subunit
VPASTLTTPGGLLLVLAVLVPSVGVLAGLAFGGHNAERVALATLPPGLGIAIAIAGALLRSGADVVYLLGGWTPPLGVALRADALSAVMLLAVAVVICGIAIYALGDFGTPAGAQARAPLTFWTLLLAVWGSLNLVLVSADLFTLYVALELLTFAAVPLVCLDGRGETLRSALRYLLFALLGSVLYLLGVALLYGGYGTLDIALLATRLRPEPVAFAAAALMTTGLLAKTALFPLHMWLPPAHAGAPAAASAVLSALVIKGSWFLVVRLWFNVLPALAGAAGMQLLAALGAGAILFGSIVALRQERLKLLIAFSTVAQIGYLFLMFPLAFDSAAPMLVSGSALAGGMVQAVSHATAKAAMFMSAGSVYAALGHDRIAGLCGMARAMPVSVLAFALGGLALIGLPPSGAYLAKELLLAASAQTGQWWWAAVIQAGGILTASYVVLVLAHALARAQAPITLLAPISRSSEAAALALALSSVLLGLVRWDAFVPVKPVTLSNGFAFQALSTTLWPILPGAGLAILLGPWGPAPIFGNAIIAMLTPARRVGLASGRLIGQVDRWLRQWPAAGVSLLVVAILLGAALMASR